MLLLLTLLMTLACSTEPTECVEWIDTCDCDSVAACVSQDEAEAATICDIDCERETGGADLGTCALTEDGCAFQ